MISIDEARERLAGLFKPEYREYIKTKLAGDFACEILSEMTLISSIHEVPPSVIRAIDYLAARSAVESDAYKGQLDLVCDWVKAHLQKPATSELLMSTINAPASFSPSPDSGVVEQWENEGGGSPVDLSMPPVGEVVDSVATTGTNPPSGAFVGHDEEWQVKHWIDLGHSEHCAARLVYGDGVCECGHGRAQA